MFSRINFHSAHIKALTNFEHFYTQFAMSINATNGAATKLVPDEKRWAVEWRLKGIQWLQILLFLVCTRVVRTFAGQVQCLLLSHISGNCWSFGSRTNISEPDFDVKKQRKYNIVKKQLHHGMFLLNKIRTILMHMHTN